MPSLLDDDDREALVRRLANLTPAAERRWGRLTPEGMLGHLCASMRMALGELPVRSKKVWPLRVFPLKHLMLYVLPIPKGAPTARELIPDTPGEFEAERGRLLALLRAIGAGPKDGPGPEHPLFGPLTAQEWGVLGYKHIDHHLRQFGV